MEPRIKDVLEKGKEAYKAMYGLTVYLSKSSIEQSLLELLAYRVSQINGCAFCLDMHSKDLRIQGETEQRIYGLDAWREAPYYTERERAALSWAESVTNVRDGHIPDDIFEEVRQQFSEDEIIELTMAVAATNCWNRINIAFRTPAGSYQPGEYAVQTQ